jgi:hypothetical protein
VLTGQRYRLRVETFAIEAYDTATRHAITVPAGATITVLAGPRPNDARLVDVQWGNRMLVMFVEDVASRGDTVKRELVTNAKLYRVE